jgi:hypothetical protein
MTQNNLADALSDLASASVGTERARLLAEAVAAYRSALEVFTRESLPQDWADTQNNLALVLRDQASGEREPLRSNLLRQAIEAMRCQSEVFTQEVDPGRFDARRRWIAEVEDDIAKANAP